MLDESGHGEGAGGGPRKQSGTAAQPARVSQRARGGGLVDSRREAQAFVIGGNESTLAIVHSLRPSGGTIVVRLVSVARTPAGIVVGENHQDAGVPLAGIFDWVDRTFPPDDENAFVASMRDLELLARVGWESSPPERIDEAAIVNVEDLPDDVAEALAASPAALTQCAACRRLCVTGEFVWKEKQLCAWDYHAQVFGRRGPWHEDAYEDRHFETLPSCAYVVEALLDELGVQPVIVNASLPEATARAVVNGILAADRDRPHMAVRTGSGMCVLREATAPSADAV